MELHGFLGIDKPLGWTSHDVVARLRRIVGTRRVGHAGTLDPAATGVLVCGIGRATKFLDLVQGGSKAYVAHVVLGVNSDTADIDGRAVTGLAGESIPGVEEIERGLTSFVGDIDQVPPKYSAVKQGGEPLYKRMRRGETVDVPTRRVRVDEIQVLFYRYPDLFLWIRCGSGVYVRSLAEDIGAALDSGAYLHHLLRTEVGGFGLDRCWMLEELSGASFPRDWTAYSTATDAGISALPAVVLERSQVSPWYHGRSVNAEHRNSEHEDSFRAYTPDGTFAGLGLAQRTGAGNLRLQPRTVLASS